MQEQESKSRKKRCDDSKIVKLGKMLKNDDALKRVGSSIVKAAVKSAAAEKLGLKMTNPMVVREVTKGEIVPSDLRSVEGLAVDAEFRARTSWCKSWLNLIIWGRAWSEHDYDRFRPEIYFAETVAIKAEVELQPDEWEIVNELDIMSGLGV